MQVQKLSLEREALRPAASLERKAPSELRRPGVDICPICNLDLNEQPLNEYDDLSVIGTPLRKLGCGHRVHKTCWHAHDTREIKQWASQLKRKEVPLLFCPVCNEPHGTASLSILGFNNGMLEGDRSHRARNFNMEWWRRDADELIYQILGYAYQQHHMQGFGKEGGLAEEKVFITSCKNRCQKVKGGMRAIDNLDAACKEFCSAHDYTTEPDAQMTRPERHFLAVKPHTLKPLLEALVKAMHAHLVDPKKAKKDCKEATKWMGILKRWLFSAGLDESSFEGVHGLGVK
jgi:hypothetical protein